jgi:2-polyprenyl-6-methoxyphenol hydroxylase-like FAD-dependent oxidoreductase
VHFGQRFERFERSAGGRVRACFAGGGSATGDLLVGADGTASAVQPLLLPDAGLDELGWFLYGRTPILPGTLERLPAELVDSFNRMTAPDGVAVAVATCRTREPLEVATARLAPGLRLGAVPDYLAWQVDAGPGRPRPPEGDARALHLLALELLADWPAPVRGIVEHAEPAATFLVRLRSARPVGPWHDPGVTLLGDAIHTMSPGRGEGANTALRDAALLAGQLAGVAAGRLPLAVAKRRYEEEMLRYSFETVAASKQLPFGPRPAPAGPG